METSKHLQVLQGTKAMNHSSNERFTITVPKSVLPGGEIRVAFPGSLPSRLFKLPMNAKPGQMVEVTLSNSELEDQSHADSKSGKVLDSDQPEDQQTSNFVSFVGVVRLILILAFLMAAMFLGTQAYQV